MKQNKIYIYGKHALKEALLYAPHVLDRIFIAKGSGDRELQELIKNSGIKVSSLSLGKAPQSIKDREVHQGIIGRISIDKLVQPYEKYINKLEINEDTALLLLGEIEDPHNVGAIIRSAAAFGISGVLIPRHKQAPVTGTVVKVSAGMAFRVPLIEIGNINMVVRDLKDKGFWIYGLDGESKHSLSEETFNKPSVFILGNEARGIRQKTGELCDVLLSIQINPKCESLNVAASTAVTLFEWSSQHKNALKK
ncbi:23S rRNA (guanosine(2251)-2'-O)-methyltransferase RlmB [Patescibacteria group bacterium]|nr:23S rRNA (guanosine(2251)-2'-O)-methyltransferase RlmB [Patescibacteria group bacterium]